MIQRQHYIEIYINGQLAELESQDGLNLRMNNVLFQPVKAATRQVEYSYSFSLPATPVNNKIFDYANVLSKKNKFHNRYSAIVYADGQVIFNGSLTVSSYSAKKYECNLVNIKVSSIDDIFGDAKLTDLPWYVDFNGGTTINSINNDLSTKYYFPFVSYGVFQKRPYHTDDIANDYTDKFVLDKYNRYWVETFYPSLNTLEHVRRAFEWKGYNVVGNAFNDENIADIYESCNLASEQQPVYNIGNPRFGKINIRSEFTNTGNTQGWVQDLTYPAERVDTPMINGSVSLEDTYNFSQVICWNAMGSGTSTVQLVEPSYVYDPDEQLIVIPADGYYKIRFKVNAVLNNAGSRFSATQWHNTFEGGENLEEKSMQITNNLNGQTPLEIQLIRNYDDNIELIKGKKNVRYHTGDPNEETYRYHGGGYTSQTYVNKEEWDTEFPHQDLMGSTYCTKTDGLYSTSLRQTATRLGGGNGIGGSRNDDGVTSPTGGSSSGNGSGKFGRRGAPTTTGSSTSNYGGARNSNEYYGYRHNGKMMVYDQVVSKAFICGFSSMGEGQMAIMRNGYSWSRMTADKNNVFGNVAGYTLVKKDNTSTNTEYCSNSYNNSTNTFSCTTSSMSGEIQMATYLSKNDLLEVVIVQRDFDGKKYTVNANVELEITAMSDRTYEQLRADASWGYNSQTEFPTQLNLSNFTNAETNISDYINNVASALNLDIIQNGNDVEINLAENIINNNDNQYAVELDNRLNSDSSDITTEAIEYPRRMAVAYKIDQDEWGFERTVPDEYINADDWYEHGDSGYTVVELSDDTYVVTDEISNINFSYTYYDDFDWKEVTWTNTSGYTETGTEEYIRIPVIEKSEYMAPGYGYDEAMKHDGYSLTQRMWYRQEPDQKYVILGDNQHETIWLSYPVNRNKNNFNLSYKNTEKSLLTERFSLKPMLSSNYITVETYLTPEEYRCIKGGALVHFNSDLHYVAEIGAYDPSGQNPTELKLITKV